MKATRPEAASLDFGQLEKGTLHAEVTPTEGQASWRFEAGPFSVSVKGTAFSTSWDPSRDTFRIVMREGRVIVEGPVLETPRELVAGDELRVSVAERKVRLSRGDVAQAQEDSADPAGDAAAGDGAGPAEAPPPTEPNAEQADEADGERSPEASSSAAPAERSWRSLAADGSYRRAMEELDDGRFAALAAASTQADLFLLADTARFGGRPDRAKAALLAARKRFGSSRAAFLLGKVAADQLRSPGEASQWFQTYVREAPSGALADQAWGRLLELSRGGDPKRVKALAQEYLSRFPNGGHAPLARQLVGP